MKLMKALVALLVAAGLIVPAVAIAEDRLSLSGEMRVRGWHTDYDLGDLDTDDGTQTWGDQRLRVGGTIAVAEGVSITFRTDITESNWGTTGSGNGFGSGRSGAAQQWDRAHIDLTKGNAHLRAGQFLQLYGMMDAIDSQDNGLSFDYKFGDVPFNVFFLVDDNNAEAATPRTPYAVYNSTTMVYDLNVVPASSGTAAVSGLDNSDAFVYGAKVAPKFGDVATQFFFGGYDDGMEQSVYVLGANMKAMLGAVNLAAELNYFDGDASDTVDAMGTQMMVDASMAASDALTIGGQLFYALGDDEDVQYTGLGNGFNGWDPIMDVGTNLSNEAISFGSPFNMAEITYGAEGSDVQLGSLGAMGGRLYTGFKASDDLKLGASIAYLQEEEDKYAEVDAMALAAGLVYNLMPNTTLELQLQYVDGNVTVDAVDFDEDYDVFEAGTGIFVKF